MRSIAEALGDGYDVEKLAGPDDEFLHVSLMAGYNSLPKLSPKLKRGRPKDWAMLTITKELQKAKRRRTEEADAMDLDA